MLVSILLDMSDSNSLIIITDVAADFSMPLKDATGLENSTVEFVCELTIPSDDVQWFLNDKPLQESDKVKIIKDGKKHRAVINNVSIEDEGQISVTVGDKKSMAGLYVDGKFLYTILYYKNLGKFYFALTCICTSDC